MTRLDIPELRTTFIFSSRPEGIPGDLRPLWRVGTILLILLLASRGGKSSLVRLHVLNWAIRTPESQQALRDVIAGQTIPGAVLVRIEPSLSRALDLACGEGLLHRLESGSIELTDQGKLAAEGILAENSVFSQEKRFLKEIGKSLTETLVKRLFAGRR
jgi:hypothetical protein